MNLRDNVEKEITEDEQFSIKKNGSTLYFLLKDRPGFKMAAYT